MDIFHMSDIIPQIGLPYPPYGRSNYNVPCPCCDDEPHAKHLNINLQKDVFRCPRCGFSGFGILPCTSKRAISASWTSSRAIPV